MLIFDVFKAQCTECVFDLIDGNHFVTLFVLANLTHVFQWCSKIIFKKYV